MNVASLHIKPTFTYTNRTSPVQQILHKPPEPRNLNINKNSHLTRNYPSMASHFWNPSQTDRPKAQIRICSPSLSPPNHQPIRPIQNLELRATAMRPICPKDRQDLRYQTPITRPKMELYQPIYGISIPNMQLNNQTGFRPIYNSPQRKQESSILTIQPLKFRNPLQPEFKLRSARNRPDTPPQLRNIQVQDFKLEPLPDDEYASYESGCGWCCNTEIQFDSYEEPTRTWC